MLLLEAPTPMSARKNKFGRNKKKKIVALMDLFKKFNQKVKENVGQNK